MDELTINIMYDNFFKDSDYVQLCMENLPQIIGRFITSKNFLLPKNTSDFEPIKFIYANSREELIELSNLIECYILFLNSRNQKEKNMNELILAGYLDEIYSLMDSMNLVEREESKVYKK